MPYPLKEVSDGFMVYEERLVAWNALTCLLRNNNGFKKIVFSNLDTYLI